MVRQKPAGRNQYLVKASRFHPSPGHTWPDSAKFEMFWLETNLTRSQLWQIYFEMPSRKVMINPIVLRYAQIFWSVLLDSTFSVFKFSFLSPLKLYKDFYENREECSWIH